MRFYNDNKVTESRYSGRHRKPLPQVRHVLQSVRSEPAAKGSDPDDSGLASDHDSRAPAELESSA